MIWKYVSLKLKNRPIGMATFKNFTSIRHTLSNLTKLNSPLKLYLPSRSVLKEPQEPFPIQNGDVEFVYKSVGPKIVGPKVVGEKTFFCEMSIAIFN